MAIGTEQQFDDERALKLII